MYQLNSLSEPMPGLFHCWGGTMQDVYAIVEDTTTGKMHLLNYCDFRFMTPPEELKYIIPCPECLGGNLTNGFVCKKCNDTRTIKVTEYSKIPFIGNDARVEIVCKSALGVLLPVLESINKKLSTL